MKLLPFKSSSPVSIGTELEFQIIDVNSFSLASKAKDLIRYISESKYESRIKPEVTQSMIEINSSVHHSPNDMLNELLELQKFLISSGDALNIKFSGGGTHPFQKWTMQKIFPSPRYKKLSRIYRYLSKRSTVFGQHIHVGCASGDDAIYLTHALIRYVPHFISICASSPFYQGVDTGYFSSRSTVFNSFPQSGVMPFVMTWDEFSEYFHKMKNYGIIESMKDFYWDIRPKPEFGTVEVRVCDTPLTIKKAVTMAAYIQALSLYLLTEKPIKISHDLYYLYNYNRFQASRYGFDGMLINPDSSEPKSIAEDITGTIKIIERYSNQLNTMGYLSQILENVINKKTDAGLIRQIHKQFNSLPKLVEEECKLWVSNSYE